MNKWKMINKNLRKKIACKVKNKDDRSTVVATDCLRLVKSIQLHQLMLWVSVLIFVAGSMIFINQCYERCLLGRVEL